MDENEEYFQRQASHRQSRRRFRKINQKGERQTIIDTVDPYPAGKPPIARGYHTVSCSVHYNVVFIIAVVGRYPSSVLCSVLCFLYNLLCVLVENTVCAAVYRSLGLVAFVGLSRLPCFDFLCLWEGPLKLAVLIFVLSF